MPAVWLLLVVVAQMFTPIGAMNIPRAGHQATLLPDGRVLVSGGHDDLGNGIAEAEIYSPSSGTWTLTGGNPPRIEVQDGRRVDPDVELRNRIAALITGRTGYTVTRLANGSVLIAGGIVSGRVTAAVDIYVPEP